MSAAEFISLLVGSGVLAQGFGVMRWAAGVEMRLRALESKEVAA